MFQFHVWQFYGIRLVPKAAPPAHGHAEAHAQSSDPIAVDALSHPGDRFEGPYSECRHFVRDWAQALHVCYGMHLGWGTDFWHVPNKVDLSHAKSKEQKKARICANMRARSYCLLLKKCLFCSALRFQNFKVPEG